MKTTVLFYFALLLLSPFSYGVEKEITFEKASDILFEEFTRLRNVVDNLTPSKEFNGYYEKDCDDYVILWKLDDEESAFHHERIRFYVRGNEKRKGFAVTYYKSTAIVDDVMVLRRFIGPEPTGWRNDTIDYETGEYLGRQGLRHVRLKDEERQFLEKWNITPFTF